LYAHPYDSILTEKVEITLQGAFEFTNSACLYS